MHHLPRVISDHSPLWIQLDGDTPRISSGFIFQLMWIDHRDFQKVVQDSRQQLMYNIPGLVFHRKLIRLSRRLKNWNWEVFGNVTHKKKELQETIQTLELSLQQGWDDSVHEFWEKFGRISNKWSRGRMSSCVTKRGWIGPKTGTGTPNFITS